MTSRLSHTFAAASLALAPGLFANVDANAQTAPCGLMRAQVTMDRAVFLAMARWDGIAGNRVMRDDMAMPAGVASRKAVEAMRDQFLSTHTWRESETRWMPVTGQLRGMSQLTRRQVRAEAITVLKMYRLNGSTSPWVPKRG